MFGREKTLKGKTYKFKVNKNGEGKRLDHYLMSFNIGLSRSRLKKLIDDGFILVDEKKISASKKVKEGMIIDVEIPSFPQPSVEPQTIPIEIIYEDSYLIAVNKKSGIAVHPSPSITDNTLVNAILAHCKDMENIGEKLRPGVVHRLDKETSGVLIFAKNEIAFEKLKRQFREREVKKIYLAIVLNPLIPDYGEFRTLYGRNPKNRKKFTSKVLEGKPAITGYKTLARGNLSALVEVHPLTGRTHQIRVHFSEHNHPIVGDKIYGKGQLKKSKMKNPEYEILRSINRQALHATMINFIHPMKNEKISLLSKIPEDMEFIIKNLFPQCDIEKWFEGLTQLSHLFR